MKKANKIIAAMMSPALLISAFSAVYTDKSTPVFSTDSSRITVQLSEEIARNEKELYTVWIFLVDKHDPDTYPTSGDREAVSEYYQKKNNAVITDLGIDESRISYIGMYTPDIICELTAEQIRTAAMDERIESIGLYDSQLPTEQAFTEEKLTKEEFLDTVISENVSFSDGGFVYRGDLKFDAIEDGNSYTLIIYGIDQKYYEPYIGIDSEVLRLNNGAYTLGGDASFTSGSGWQVTPADSSTAYKGDFFNTIVYVNNVLPGYPRPASDIIEASKYKNFDLAAYVYPEIIPGDIDCDGMITASDASLILAAYSYLSTGTPLTLNKTMCDYNKDGQIDPVDASDILVRYSEASTS